MAWRLDWRVGIKITITITELKEEDAVSACQVTPMFDFTDVLFEFIRRM